MITLYVGRFEPFHLGHWQTIEDALAVSEKVIVGVGSAQAERSTKNPFSYDERVRMIRASFPDEINERIYIIPLYDHVNDNAGWAQQVRTKVNALAQGAELAITGFNRDSSSFYLDLFPEWKRIGGREYKDGANATEIRNSGYSEELLQRWVHPGAAAVIREIIK